jgi:hypothetical protein
VRCSKQNIAAQKYDRILRIAAGVLAMRQQYQNFLPQLTY